MPALIRRCALSSARQTELELVVAQHGILERAVRTAIAAKWTILEAIQQDEFTFDVLVVLPDDLVLVYDTT